MAHGGPPLFTTLQKTQVVSSDSSIFFIFSKKYVTVPNRGISHSIVVVGASDVGMSALHHLAMSPHLVFNNLTLVSPTFHDDKFIPVRVEKLNF